MRYLRPNRVLLAGLILSAGCPNNGNESTTSMTGSTTEASTGGSTSTSGSTTDEPTARRLSMVWGVRSVVVPLETDPDKMFRTAGRAIIEQGLAKPDEYALIVGSLPMMRVAGRTNLVHVRKLGT